MIGYLRGIARSARVVDVGGVGYVVATTRPLVAGDEVELWIHTQVRDDAIVLYGFADEAERVVFDALVKVTGVGPATALALVANLGAAGVADAVAARNTKLLATVRGVGKTAAERIVTFVKMPDVTGADPRRGELTDTLVSLGYDRTVAAAAAAAAVDDAADGAAEADLIAAALATIGKIR